MKQPKPLLREYVDGMFTDRDGVFPELARGLPALGRALVMPHFYFVLGLAVVTYGYGWWQQDRVSAVEATEPGVEYTGCTYRRPVNHGDTTGATVCQHEGKPRSITPLSSGALFKVYDHPGQPIRCWSIRGEVTGEVWDACWIMTDTDKGVPL